MKNDMKQSTVEKKPYNNLTKNELEALNELRNRDDLIFTKADKGGALVIIDVKDYILEANRQLNDTQFYQQLTGDPTQIYSERINSTIDRFQSEGLLTNKVAEGLKNYEPKTSKFYLNPKIHKKNNPGRPVINSVDCHSSNISKYVDYHLQPEVRKLKSYTKDSTDTINKLKEIQNEIEEDDILVTMDVRSLYTNIPNNEGIQAVREKLNDSPSRLPSRVITTFLMLILSLNNFIFNGINYLQTKGCAMGTKCAPTYANIFMGKFEETHIYPRINDKTRIYLRYIDDLFFIWKGTEQELREFFDEMNTIHPTIKFDYEFSKKEIHFLDLMIFKDATGNLATKVYTKPTDCQAYLHKTSAHPNHVKTSIPYGQALRLRRICSNLDDFDLASTKLQTRLENRGYETEEITQQISEARTRNRDDLLKYKIKDPSMRIPYVLTYNQTLPNAKEAINKNWNILQINTKLKDTFKEKPIIAYRRNKNLGDILGQKTLKNGKVFRRKTIDNRKGRCSPCHSRSNCKCCRQLVNTDTFTSRKTNRKYKIFHTVNCKSKFIIYLMECIKCKIQYVGKCEWGMNVRNNKHRHDVHQPDGLHACKHFNQPTHDYNRDAKFTIIEEIKNKNRPTLEMRKILEGREDFWIKTLRTLHPDGFNMELNSDNSSY